MRIITGLLATIGLLLLNAAELKPMRLWQADAPLARGTNPADIPTLQPFLPDGVKGMCPAVLICPGGSYIRHAIKHEGVEYALFLNRHGIAAFLLRYRLGSAGYRHPAMLLDAARAMRLIRCKAETWRVDPARLGVIGSSAGGHLAATLATQFDAGNASASDPVERFSSRPDFVILCYAVVSMRDELTHLGTRNNILGRHPSREQQERLSAELQVRADTPPCFIWHTAEDAVVNPENSIELARALKRRKIPYELHIFQHGPHGIGLQTNLQTGQPHLWAEAMLKWLTANGILSSDNSGQTSGKTKMKM